MNRLRQSTGPTQEGPAHPAFSIESALLETSFPHAAYALFAPLHYEPGYAYPLIVWLHGQDGDERQLMRVMPLISMRNYAAVAPRGTGVAAAADGRACYGWRQTEDHIQQAEQRIFDCIGMARQKLHVAPRRVFLAGFDCGGTMAFRVAMSHPERFAGVLSLCGAFPTGGTPFGNLIQARQLPVFLAVGRDSQAYPPDQVCDHLRLFHTAGISVTLRQYPCGHELSPQMLADVDRWIIEQITTADWPAADSNPRRSCQSD